MKKFWKVGAIALASVMCVASFAACDKESDAIGGDITNDVIGDVTGGGTGGDNNDGIVYGEVTAEEWTAALEAISDLRDFQNGGAIKSEFVWEWHIYEDGVETVKESVDYITEWLQNEKVYFSGENGRELYKGEYVESGEARYAFKLESNGAEADLLAWYLNEHSESDDIGWAVSYEIYDGNVYDGDVDFDWGFFDNCTERLKNTRHVDLGDFFIGSRSDYLLDDFLEHPEWYERAEYADGVYTVKFTEKDDPDYDEDRDEDFSMTLIYTVKFTEGKLAYLSIDYDDLYLDDVEDIEEGWDKTIVKIVFDFDYRISQIIRPEWVDEALLEVRKDCGLA